LKSLLARVLTAVVLTFASVILRWTAAIVGHGSNTTLPASARDHRADAPPERRRDDWLRRPDPGVQRIDAALNAHGLIKVRVATTPAANRCSDAAAELGAAPINIGKLLVLWLAAMPEKRKKVSETMQTARRQEC
jgi:hypothetical protein